MPPAGHWERFLKDCACVCPARGRYFSPQLYTQGSESPPDFTEASGRAGAVGWDRFKNMKAKFVPSIVLEADVDATKTYFREQGIHVDGFVLWGQVPDVSGESGADMCVAHGICKGKGRSK